MRPVAAFFLICYSKYQKEAYCHENKQDQFFCFGNGDEAYNGLGEIPPQLRLSNRMMDFKYYLIKKAEYYGSKIGAKYAEVLQRSFHLMEKVKDTKALF